MNFMVLLLKKFSSVKFQIAGATKTTPSIGKVLFWWLSLQQSHHPYFLPLKKFFFQEIYFLDLKFHFADL